MAMMITNSTKLYAAAAEDKGPPPLKPDQDDGHGGLSGASADAIDGNPSLAEESRKRILYVEDEPDIAALVAEDLVARGFDVQIAHGGLSGLWAILENKPDLVLCDINMPYPSGFDLLKRLTAITPQIGKVPFVFLTAVDDRDSELKARHLGADDYVTKPIDFDVLAEVIRARLTAVVRTEIWPEFVSLNRREVETLTWSARGKTSVQISRILGLSKRTVDFHLDNARIKLGCATRIEAAIKATLGRLITP
jgi:DNA-binding NarL/FixJ family response regulator